MTIDRLHPGATYSKEKAISIASQLNCDELADEDNYLDGEFVGFVYSAEIKGDFGRVMITDADGEFVSYF